MAETRYIISDAARMINAEPHVLRYWEEELAIEIPRNELGHRYYTEKEIHLFENIRDLKEKGFQLKAIRLIISTLNEDAPFGKKTDEDAQITEDELAVAPSAATEEKEETDGCQKAKEASSDVGETDKNQEKVPTGVQTATEHVPEAVPKPSLQVSSADKMKHFKYIMDRIVMEALQKNNDYLEDCMISQVTDVLTETLGRMEKRQADQTERHYQLLDEAIRGRQRVNQEVAAAKVPSYGVPKLPKRKKRFFKRKFRY